MMLRFAIMLLVAALPSVPADASSPAAWAVGDRAARTACVRAARLTGAAASPALLFSDVSGKTAMLVTGRWPQPHMKGKAGAMLCLFDRRTQRADVVEARNWTAPRR